MTMRPSGGRPTRHIGFLLAAMGAHWSLYGQTAALPDLHFDVASVRQNRTAACKGRWDLRYAHGVVTAENAPLRRIISRAFNMTDDRVAGPAWLDSECYDIRAKASNTVPDKDLLRMLEGLVRERFHMIAHRESDERPIFALFVDKDGPKLHAYGDNVPVPSPTTDGRVLFMVRHVPDLCERIGKVMGRPVVDKTGLNGDYVIVLTYLPFIATGGDPSDPPSDILSAVRDQLGLRLESQRGVVEILKIDAIDKVPTEN
jgi:uncharacterized protein (TIGR03435 family)